VSDVPSQSPAEGDERAVLTDRQGHPVYVQMVTLIFVPRGIPASYRRRCRDLA
jgi:hypothetical protein